MRTLSLVALAGLCTVIAQPLAAAEWSPIPVPGTWEEKGPAEAKSYDGIAWYRTWVKVHDSFFTKHERNLFEESVSVNIRNLADAHEVYVNGKKIGAARPGGRGHHPARERSEGHAGDGPQPDAGGIDR